MPELHYFQKRKTGFQQCPKTNLLISDLALLPYNTLWSMMTDWVTLLKNLILLVIGYVKATVIIIYWKCIWLVFFIRIPETFYYTFST